jgi:hypothetical protein
MYAVLFGTGAGDEFGFETVEAAKEYADSYATYTQCSISIVGEVTGEVMCSRTWWGLKFDSGLDPSENPIQFGYFGYYADWE